jgi:hypothetical protein
VPCVVAGRGVDFVAAANQSEPIVAESQQDVVQLVVEVVEVFVIEATEVEPPKFHKGSTQAGWGWRRTRGRRRRGEQGGRGERARKIARARATGGNALTVLFVPVVFCGLWEWAIMVCSSRRALASPRAAGRAPTSGPAAGRQRRGGGRAGAGRGALGDWGGRGGTSSSDQSRVPDNYRSDNDRAKSNCSQR